MTVGETDTPLQVVVRAEDEARAREVLGDLTAAGDTPANAGAAAEERHRESSDEHRTTTPAVVSGSDDVDITDAETGAPLGRLTAAQFDSLAAHLERESARDDDYFIDQATMAMLEEKPVDAAAMGLLRQALAGRSDITIRWRR